MNDLITFFTILGTSFYLSFSVPDSILRSGQARFANSIYVSTIASLLASLVTKRSDNNAGIKWIKDLQIQNDFYMPKIVYILALVGLLLIVCGTLLTHIDKSNSKKPNDQGHKNYMATLLSLVVTVISILALYTGLTAELSMEECRQPESRSNNDGIY